MKQILKKLATKEIITYFIFGVLTTLLDWIVYALMRWQDIDYIVATVGSWAAAVAFAFITNKLFVFRSFDFHPGIVVKELTSFVACRLLTGVFSVVAMIVLVDYLGIHDFISKVILSAIVLVLNYIGSKLFIFKKKSCEV